MLGSLIQNVTLVNCTFLNAKKPSIIQHVEDLTLKHVEQSGD